MNRTIDYSPLFVEPSRDEVAAFRRESLAADPTAAATQVVRIAGWVVGGLLLLIVSASVLVPITIGVARGGGSLDLPSLVSLAPPVAILIVVIALVIRAVTARRGDWSQRLRMARFASANALHYAPTSPPPAYPGAIFGLGSSRQVSDHFRTTDERYLDFGNYRYVTGSGRSRTTHDWGFLALHLDRALPHMVLDSRANNGLLGSTNLPAVFSRDQVLSLEGDFDTHFTLYCPKEYERDALYVFTPDLMALLIDEAAPYDVEIVDRWMLVYSARPFPLADPATYQRLLRIVSTVGAKTLTQTDRYVDERIGDFAVNLVAPAGKRLRRGFPWLGIVVVVVFLAVWFNGVFGGSLN